MGCASSKPEGLSAAVTNPLAQATPREQDEGGVAAAPTAAVFECVLAKKSSRINWWNKRFFVLEGAALRYGKRGAKPKYRVRRDSPGEDGSYWERIPDAEEAPPAMPE